MVIVETTWFVKISQEMRDDKVVELYNRLASEMQSHKISQYLKKLPPLLAHLLSTKGKREKGTSEQVTMPITDRAAMLAAIFLTDRTFYKQIIGDDVERVLTWRLERRLDCLSPKESLDRQNDWQTYLVLAVEMQKSFFSMVKEMN